MYCSQCGSPVPTKARFCSGCGASLGPRQPRTAPTWIVVTWLVLFFPVGLWLMWERTSWDDDVKWAVSGLFFPPVWAALVLRRHWSAPLRVAISALLLVLFVILLALKTSAEAVVALTVLGLLAMFLIGRATFAPETRASTGALRRLIESKLDTCHDLISEVESTLVIDPMLEGSPSRREYQHALEMRQEAMALYERARSRDDLLAADARVDRALEALRRSRDDVLHQPRDPRLGA